jgi:hypothetical protein
MSNIFDILASNANLSAQIFAIQTQQASPLAMIEREIETLRGDVATIGSAVFAVYNASARMVAFDAALGQLLGIVV